MPFQSFEDIFKNKSPGFSGFQSFDDIFKSSGVGLGGFIPFNDIFGDRKTQVQPVREPEPQRKYGGVGNVLEQFARGAVREATFGLSKFAIEEEVPIGVGESIARGAGQLAGFFSPLGVAGKIVKPLVKPAGKAVAKVIRMTTPKATDKIVEGSVKLFEHLIKHTATLSTATVLSDITNIAEAPDRALSGATLGAIFGASGLIKIQGSKVLDQLARQTAGRALLAVAGHYDSELFTEEGLPDLVFGEMLNTFFLRRGISPRQLISGEAPAKAFKEAEKLQEELHRFDFGIEVASGKKAPTILKRLNDTVGNGKLTPTDVQLMNTIEHFRYDIKTRKIYPLEKPSILPRRYKEPSEMTKKEFILAEDMEKEWEFRQFSGVDTSEPVQHKYKEGDLLISNLRENPDIFKMQYVDPNRVDFNLEGISRKDVVNTESTQKYIKWMKEGKEPPPVIIVKKSTGIRSKVLFSLNRRRILAAQESGIKMIPAFIEIGKHRDIIKKALSEGIAVPKEVLSEYSDLKKTTALDRVVEQVGENDVILHRDLKTGEMDMLDFGKNVKLLSEEAGMAMLLGAKKKAQDIIDFPTKKIDRVTEVGLDKMLEKLNTVLPATDIKTMKNLAGIEGSIKYRDLVQLESQLKGYQINPANAATAQGNTALEIVTDGRIVGDPVFQNKTIEKKFREIAANDNNKRVAEFTKIDRKIRKGENRGTVLSNLMSLGVRDKFGDIRFTMESKERRTGLPWYRLWLPVNESKHVAKTERIDRMEPMRKVGVVGEAVTREIQKYYDTVSDLYRAKAIKEGMKKELHDALSPKAKEWVAAGDSIMFNARPEIKRQKWNDWFESWEEVRDGKRDRTRPVYKEQKKLELKLREAAIQYANFGKHKTDVGRQFLDRFLSENEFGLIEAGSYLPGVFLSENRRQMLDFAEISRQMAPGMSRHVKRRTKIAGVEQIRDVAREQYMEKDITARLNSYIQNLMNTKHVKVPLEGLEKLTAMVEDHLNRAGFKPDAKENKFIDYMRLYAHRVKGYPVKVGEIGRIAKKFQSAFFRSLVVRPFLWNRNLFQRYVTVPDKAVITDLRFSGIINKRMQFKNIPKEYKDRFDTEISQFEPMREHYFFLSKTEGAKSWPLIGGVIQLAEKVGTIYPLTDLLNRRSVFAKTFNRTSFYLNKFKNGEMTMDEVHNKLKIWKMKSGEQKEFQKALEQGVGEAAYLHGKWMTDNSQWKYDRSEKSLYEMTGEGEAFTNLLTWTKGIVQRMTSSVEDVYRGYAEKNYRRAWGGVKEIGGMMLAAKIASTALQQIGMKHGSRYADYGTDMFFWEIGGVSLDLVKGLTSTMANLVSSVDGTKDERRRALNEALKFFDNEGSRQMMPFMKNVLSTIEAITGRSYISPLYDLISKKTPTKVDRTMVERFTHAIFSTDPNKSKDVYRHATEQYEKYKRRYRLNTNPVTKPLDYIQFKRYEQMSNILDRYQPFEVHELFNKTRGVTDRFSFTELLAQQRRATAKARRAWR